MNIPEFIVIFCLIMASTVFIYDNLPEVTPITNTYKVTTYNTTCAKLDNLNFTCVFDKSQNTYWENVFPSEQCAGKSLSQMKDYEILQATGSMRPYIYQGDIVYTVPYNKRKELVLGDVVHTGTLLHRIVSINVIDRTFVTKGDNNDKFDRTKFKFDDIEWIVCGVMRGTTK